VKSFSVKSFSVKSFSMRSLQRQHQRVIPNS
jgi:hypothetical protein